MWAQIQRDRCPYRKRQMPCEDRETHVTGEAEMGALKLQIKELQGRKAHRKPEGVRKDFTKSQRDHGPADTV